MTVANNERADEDTFNESFMSREEDTGTTGRVELAAPSGPSGTTIQDAQREFNSIASYLGKLINGAKDLLPSWLTSNRGTETDTIQARIEDIDAAFNEVDGHTHSGFPGDGPPIPATSIDGVLAIDQGGTGSSEADIAFANLSPAGTDGEVLVKDSAEDAGARFTDTFETPKTFQDTVNFEGAAIFKASIATQKLDVATAATIAALSSAKSIVRLLGSTATALQGIVAGGDGQIITIHNASSAIITLMHEDAGASAANQMVLPNTTDIELEPNTSIELFYDIDQTRWLIKSGSGSGSGAGGLASIYPTLYPASDVIAAGEETADHGRKIVFVPGAAQSAVMCFRVPHNYDGEDIQLRFAFFPNVSTGEYVDIDVGVKLTRQNGSDGPSGADDATENLSQEVVTTNIAYGQAVTFVSLGVIGAKTVSAGDELEISLTDVSAVSVSGSANYFIRQGCVEVRFV